VSTPPSTQATILQRIASDDRGAVQLCIDAYGPLVGSLARRMGFSGGELDDAVQDVFVALWRSAQRFDPALAGERAFVAMIARRRLIDLRRRLGRRAEGAATEVAEELSSGERPAVEALAVRDEGARARAALGELRPEQRRVIELSVMEGLSHQEIADSTGMPLGTVKTHARRGLQRVRELLGRATDSAPRGVGA
jgi:RNA polymerase sigma-70 factor (ECF subfamily)